MSDDRSLRDALEKAQARTRQLEQESEDREALRAELVEVRQALDDALRRLLPAPGESRELVRLHAQVHAQQLQLNNLVTERDKLLARVAELAAKKK